MTKIEGGVEGLEGVRGEGIYACNWEEAGETKVNLMTYAVAVRLQRGLVFAADTRTNAGIDNIIPMPPVDRDSW